MLNRPEEALAEAERGLRIAETCGEVYELGYLHRTRALCYHSLGKIDDAVEALEVSIKTFGDYRNPYETARSTQLLARLYARTARAGGRSYLLKARSALHSCVDGFHRLGERRDEMISNTLLANVERRLGNLGDALSAVCAADHLAAVDGDSRFQWALRTLRSRVESGMSRLPTPVMDELSAPCGLSKGSSSRQDVGFENFVTENDEMIRIMNLAERVAGSRATVLLLGDTGTGKGMIASAIHAMSARSDKRFVHVNCAAMPEQLLESELFGHVRGSFTGAFADKNGLLHEADGGTIFLDEIGKTSLAMQGKLLQFLDTGRVRKVGSNDLRTVDVRIVCASKTDLQKLIKNGCFLEDLFYRINDFPLTIPPLRHRPEDIVLIMNHYIDLICREMNRPVRGVTDEFLAHMRAYRWPGNVRELEKVVRRALILAGRDDILDVTHLPVDLLRASGKAPEGDDARTLRDRLAEVERDEIRIALHRHAGNKSRVATRLGISYPSLLAKLKRYNLQ
jgi:DNA-binding NtrC family response regulator